MLYASARESTGGSVQCRLRASGRSVATCCNLLGRDETQSACLLHLVKVAVGDVEDVDNVASSAAIWPEPQSSRHSDVRDLQKATGMTRDDEPRGHRGAAPDRPPSASAAFVSQVNKSYLASATAAPYFSRHLPWRGRGECGSGRSTCRCACRGS